MVLWSRYAVVPRIDTDYAAQAVVDEVVNEDTRFIEKEPLPITEEFPEGSRAFFLGEFNFGRPLEVLDIIQRTKLTFGFILWWGSKSSL